MGRALVRIGALGAVGLTAALVAEIVRRNSRLTNGDVAWPISDPSWRPASSRQLL